MPKGTVHQAVAQQEASTHLTISSYQNFSLGTLAQAVLHSAMQGQEEPVCLPLSLRKGLPPGFLYAHGFQVSFLCSLCVFLFLREQCWFTVIINKHAQVA